MNLASEPFHNRRLFWVVIAAVFVVCLWASLWIAAESARASARADELQTRIGLQQAEVERLRAEQEKRKQEVRQTVLTETDLRQLAAARRLLGLKSLSWDRLINSLEGYVPKRARIISISVDEAYNPATGTAAQVEIKAVGESAAQMTEMMSNLERSGGLFQLGQASQEAPTESNEIPFTLVVTYKPYGRAQ